MMTSRSFNRADLTEAIYREVGLSRNESADLVTSVLEIISDTLSQGEQVKISSFASFFVRSKKQRIGRNPKTGTEAPISPRKVVVFRPSLELRELVKGGHATKPILITHEPQPFSGGSTASGASVDRPTPAARSCCQDRSGD